MSAPLHPASATLRAYALGELPPEAEQFTDAHLLRCQVCRAQVLGWRAELVRQVEALPVDESRVPLRSLSAAPPVLQFAPRRWPTLALVVAVTLLALAALGWTGIQQRQLSSLQTEQRQVASWLADPGVKLLHLTDRQRQPSGQVLVSARREVLFVLPTPPQGKVYQVWVAAHWHRGDPLTPTVRSGRGLVAAAVGDNDYVCVSLEDKSRDMTGQTKPTQLLGWTML